MGADTAMTLNDDTLKIILDAAKKRQTITILGVEYVPKPIPPVEPERTEWALSPPPNMYGYAVYDPDWVLVRPCDLRPGDRIAWGKRDAEIVVVEPAGGYVYVAYRNPTLPATLNTNLSSWSPVLVRRGQSDDREVQQ